MKKYSLLAPGLLMLLLASCLKDKNVEDQVYGMAGATRAKLVELPNRGNPVTTFALDFKDSALTLDGVEVRLTSNDLPKNDITVSLSTTNSQAIIDDYNAENGTTYIQMPSSLYQIDATTPLNSVIIPAGQRSVFVKIKTNAINFDPSETYAIGFEIASVADPSFAVSGNFKTHIVTLGAKNAYDGRYSITWTNYHPSSNPGYTGASSEIEMHTIGANTNKMYWPLAGGYAIPSVLGGGLSYFSSQEPAYTIDPVTNKVTVMNTVGSVVYSMAANYDSHYDPGTRTYYVRFGYNYDPGGIFNPATNREWTQEFKYIGPR